MKKMMLLLISLLVFSIAFAAIQQPEEKPSAKECWDIRSIGFASGDNPAVLDPNKIVALLQINENDYYCIKNILGLWDYNFYITLTDISGNNFVTVYSPVWGVANTGIVGVFPGNNILVSNINADLAGDISVSPTYKLPSGGFTAYFVWDPQPKEGVLAEPEPEDIQKVITSDVFNFQNTRTLKRVVVIDNGEDGYQTALLTLGVWY